MNITPSHPGLSERNQLARLLPAPVERDLPEERHRALKQFMTSELHQAPASARRARRRVWRRPVVLLPMLAAATAMAMGLSDVVGQSPAYAVTKNTDGTLTLEIHRWDDAKKLQSDLRAMGVSIVVDYVPGGKRCRPPRITDPVPREQYRHTFFAFAENHRASEGFVTRLDPSAISSGQTAVIEYYHPENGSRAFNGWIANGPVAPCVLENSARPW